MRRSTMRLFATALCGALALSPLLASAEGGRGHDRDRDRGGRMERGDDRREERHDRRDWHFERGRGWRYEVRPGFWSPFFVWWWLDGREVLRPYPSRTIVSYSNGQYELRGDGYRVPYYWVWIPAVRVAPPQPPPPPETGEDYGMAPEPPSPEVRPEGGKDVAGMVIGGVVGGALGSTVGKGGGRTAGVIVGTLLGALFGHEIGRNMDDADELRAAYALEKNKTRQTSTWVNPDTGAKVAITPKKTFKSAAGEQCRDYQTDITIDGEMKTAYGTACRQPDGQWVLGK